MSGTLTWKIDDQFKRMVEISNGGICLVKDQGVYLMAGYFPDNIVCYAEGFDPSKDDFDDWYSDARRICGGDDFVETIPAPWFSEAIKDGHKKVRIKLTDDEMELILTS